MDQHNVCRYSNTSQFGLWFSEVTKIFAFLNHFLLVLLKIGCLDIFCIRRLCIVQWALSIPGDLFHDPLGILQSTNN